MNSLRGLERIRTAVDGFADHCLATRPRDLNWKPKIRISSVNYVSFIREL